MNYPELETLTRWWLLCRKLIFALFSYWPNILFYRYFSALPTTADSFDSHESRNVLLSNCNGVFPYMGRQSVKI